MRSFHYAQLAVCIMHLMYDFHIRYVWVSFLGSGPGGKQRQSSERPGWASERLGRAYERLGILNALAGLREASATF